MLKQNVKPECKCIMETMTLREHLKSKLWELIKIWFSMTTKRKRKELFKSTIKPVLKFNVTDNFKPGILRILWNWNLKDILKKCWRLFDNQKVKERWKSEQQRPYKNRK